MNKIEFSRQIIKRTTQSSNIPTINTGSTIDSTWLTTDILIGELFLNLSKDRMWTRTNSGIFELNLTPISAATKSQYVEIGDWDMDTIDSVSYAHNLSSNEWKTVQSIGVIIKDDPDTNYTDFKVDGNTIEINSSNIVLKRTTGGVFDSTNYSATTYNRGWMTFMYKPD